MTGEDAIRQVGECTVDPSTNEVTRDGEILHLEPRSMEVLGLLIRRAGEVVSREELQDEVWGEVVVGDESLTNAIIKIRRAFGDDARNPRYVETIPKRGYRLIAPVGLATPSDAAAGAAGPSRRAGLRVPLIVALMAGAAMLAILVWTQFPTTKPSASPTEPRALHVHPPGDLLRVGVRSFQGFGDDVANAYLARGIEETVINRLSGRPDLVLMRASDGAEPIVDLVIEGSVRAVDGALSASFRILDAHDGAILASEEIAPPVHEPLALEQEVERKILGALARDLERAGLNQRAAGYTDSTDAFDLFLQARAALLLRTADGNRRARRLYRESISHDPRFARAYGGLALTLAADYRNGWAEDPQSALEDALRMAQTALQIAPDLPEQHWVVGYVRTQQRRFQEATEALTAALRLQPEYADAYALLGGIATYDGRPEETVPLLRKAIRLRPQAGYLYYLLLGRAYYFMDQCDQAEINLGEALHRNAESIEAHLYHAACLVRSGHLDDAEWEREEVSAVAPGLTLREFFASYPLNAADRIRRLQADLETAGFR
ncbi:MAG: hypothetical protein D6688_03575 [Alphaproteobacteria bacterium]|nr:MAG: hypothetical protein D6688_03575 [Alphaproteobacteria bacterium]